MGAITTANGASHFWSFMVHAKVMREGLGFQKVLTAHFARVLALTKVAFVEEPVRCQAGKRSTLEVTN